MSLIAFGYGTAAAAFLLLLAFLVVRRRYTWPFNYLLAFALLMVVWAGAIVITLPDAPGFGALILIESLHGGAGLLFLGQLVGRGNAAGWRRWFLWAPWITLGIGALAFVASLGGRAVSFQAVYYFIVAISLAGLLAAEQIYRNTGFLKPSVATLVAVAFATLFVFDLYTYSNALWEASLNESLLAARGFVNALTVPLLVLAIKREPEWRGQFFVSRQIVFYSASLIGVGLYLLLVAFGSLLIQRFGGDVGAVLRVIFLAASLVLLVLVLFSRPLRRRAKVFVATHFYANRYDYREEWLRLINRLAQDSSRAPMPELCLSALADIIDSDAGVLWLADDADEGRYRVAARFGDLSGAAELPAEHPLAPFMAESGWVVDGAEAADDPGHYDHQFDTATDPVVSAERLFVPIVQEGSLTGIVALNRPQGMPQLNFEDHDLLRTVGKQLAVFLQLERSNAELTEAREFQVLNRFTAFVMHDMKNLVAQLSMVVTNAERHKTNPAFVEDAISTIANSVQRMNALIAQLKAGSESLALNRFDLGEAIREAVEATRPRVPAPQVRLEGQATITTYRSRLVSGIEHLIRNAQDACSGPEDTVRVELRMPADGMAEISVTDTGQGMSDDFIRDRLFKPFYSTKGAKGMGIGAYQVRDYVQSMGGEMQVDSSPGEGTRICLRLPLAVNESTPQTVHSSQFEVSADQ